MDVTDADDGRHLRDPSTIEKRRPTMIQPTFAVTAEELDGNTTLVLEPLEKGYGHTLGNALRRVLLSSLDGVAITSVKVKGVNHQFTTLQGMSEDIVELILNLKQVRLQSKTDGPFTLTIDAKKQKEVTAKDIQVSGDVTVVNKDLHLASLVDGATLSVEMTAERGLGYSLASERKSEVVGLIPVDAMFSPVVKVSYTVVSTRVGRKTDFDKLVMNITTDGTVDPKDALEKAAKVLVRQFQQVYEPVFEEAPVVVLVKDDGSLKLSIEELDLPTRISNAFKKAGYKTVEDLLMAGRSTLVKVKNLGEKSIEIVEEALNKRSLSLKDA
ncbi:MAG: DNA-directed RNA polymerase subunit alpha [Microgenomates group bacterium GW2011_GWF2_45_18]|nr:MAG: DNA-directed RNA polymerase subunit alpha [Microgenomates group bacterium GW2011_GWF1_44_10]KKU01993.1 MAG: DNA-directed RNA polymerase subunit alpha [Microgenomates group bacterium GW2011_GWF2_45_18]